VVGGLRGQELERVCAYAQDEDGKFHIGDGVRIVVGPPLLVAVQKGGLVDDEFYPGAALLAKGAPKNG
jgi:hypothetical protein